MARNRCAVCGADALEGYNHCPAHLADYEVSTIDEDFAEPFMRIYQAQYVEAQMSNAVEAYAWCQEGFEVASRYTNRAGELRFCLVKAG